MTLGGQMGSPNGTVQLSSSNGTVWNTELFWKASDRYQAETGEVLCRMIPGVQAFLTTSIMQL